MFLIPRYRLSMVGSSRSLCVCVCVCSGGLEGSRAGEAGGDLSHSRSMMACINVEVEKNNFRKSARICHKKASSGPYFVVSCRGTSLLECSVPTTLHRYFCFGSLYLLVSLQDGELTGVLCCSTYNVKGFVPVQHAACKVKGEVMRNPG